MIGRASRSIELSNPDVEPLTCEKCGMKNSPGTNLCIRCGSEISSRLQVTEHVTEKVEKLMHELRDPEVLEDFVRRLKEKFA